jgi:hypothetical protein
VTIDPSKPPTAPLNAALFSRSGDSITISNIRFFDRKVNNSAELPELLGLKEWYSYSNNVKACVGVGSRNTYTIRVYYYDDRGRIVSASIATGPYDIQANYQMEYDTENKLISISSGKKIWERKQL